MLPVVMNNLAYFYYRKHKYPAAHSYMTKAMTLERKAYGAVDFATHLRMAAVSARLSHHTVSLKHCKAALKVLQEAADLHGGHGGAPAAARTYHAHLAVVYHNLAVQMAYLQQLQHAAGTAKVAQQLVTQALPAKHRWVRCPPAHACALDAHHCLRTACALPAHCMRTACALHAHTLPVPVPVPVPVCRARRCGTSCRARGGCETCTSRPPSSSTHSGRASPAARRTLRWCAHACAVRPCTTAAAGSATPTSPLRATCDMCMCM